VEVVDQVRLLAWYNGRLKEGPHTQCHTNPLAWCNGRLTEGPHTHCRTRPSHTHIDILVIEPQEGLPNVCPSRGHTARLADIRLLYIQVAAAAAI
jgi:hypothetical protein